MISSKIALCAEGVTVDQETNNISIFHILEEMNVEFFPLFMPKIIFFSLIEKSKDEPKNFKTVLKVLINRTIIHEFPYELHFDDKLRTRLIITILGLAITKPGKLKFILYNDEKKLCSHETIIRTKSPAHAVTKQI